MSIAGWYKQGWIPEEIARRLELTLAQVHAARAYYHANQEEIEADLATEAAEYDRLQREQEQEQEQMKMQWTPIWCKLFGYGAL